MLKERLSRKAELVLIAFMLGAGTIGLSACEEGPVEETGEEVDDALDDVGDELDDVGDELE